MPAPTTGKLTPSELRKLEELRKLDALLREAMSKPQDLGNTPAE